MKYKVGDEVLVKARIIEVKEGEKYPYKIKRSSNLVCGNLADSIYVGESDIVQKPDMTAEEAWEIAKKLFADYSNIELDEIFGKGWSFPKLMELTPQEAKAKIEAWETEKEIKVGDEVIPEKGHYKEGKRGLVICINDGVGVVHSEESFTWYEKKYLKKTGRHIDIDGLLKQIGGDK